MRFRQLFAFLVAIGASSALEPSTEPQRECRKLNTDPDWPSAEIWKAELPGVLVEPRVTGLASPDYRLRVRTAAEVQKAVDFANKHNVRLSVIATGHDYLGRNTGSSGLMIDLSFMKGINVLESFTPTKEGVQTITADQQANVITPKEGVQAAVTVGPGVMTATLNRALSPSKLFTMGAGHGSVSVIGGWAQLGGHAPLGGKYGLGVDQFLEAKVVTPDGNLIVANEVSNPDIFWAIRGGGGGTFGVVVEATVKAHPDGPVTAVTWFLRAINPFPTSLDAPMGYLFNRLPELNDQGVSGYIECQTGHASGLLFHSGDIAGVEAANKIWKPLLEKMETFPGIQPFQSMTYQFDNFTSFYQRNFGVMKKSAKMIQKRHNPGEKNSIPQAKGLVPFDSHLLSADNFRSPDIMSAFKSTMGNYEILFTVPGSKIKRNGTSLHPSWASAIAHVSTMDMAPIMSGESLRKFAPEMGSYANEGNYAEPDWKNSFWGSNYARLSEIKSKIDPNGTFWVTPGINADHFEVLNGRVCRRDPSQQMLNSGRPPKTDNQNKGEFMDRNYDSYGRMDLIADAPVPGTWLGMNSIGKP